MELPSTIEKTKKREIIIKDEVFFFLLACAFIESNTSKEGVKREKKKER